MLAVPQELLVAAARSPDPAVRAMVVKRMEIAAEAARIDKALAERADVLKAGTAALTDAATDAALPARSLSKPEFVALVTFVLARHGAPMQPRAIQQKVVELYPSFATNTDQMRKRLHGTKDVFQHVEGQGYWPVSILVPAP